MGTPGRKPGSPKTGGRQKGTPNKASAAREAAIVEAGGITPLDHMLKVMWDTRQDPERRDDMAKAAAPYVHPKLATTTITVAPKAKSALELWLNGERSFWELSYEERLDLVRRLLFYRRDEIERGQPGPVCAYLEERLGIRDEEGATALWKIALESNEHQADAPAEVGHDRSR